MPQHESNREDLLREATALVDRVELRVPGFHDPIVAGFRRDGAASFFFGADPVYQFNSAGELRRGFVGGLLYKAERGGLIALRRERSDTEVALLRTELKSEETKSPRASARDDLTRLHRALEAATFSLVGEVPAGAGVAGRVRQWMDRLPPTIRAAQAPNAR